MESYRESQKHLARPYRKAVLKTLLIFTAISGLLFFTLKKELFSAHAGISKLLTLVTLLSVLIPTLLISYGLIPYSRYIAICDIAKS